MPGMRRREFVSAARWRGGGVAARGERAATGDAGDRIPQLGRRLPTGAPLLSSFRKVDETATSKAKT